MGLWSFQKLGLQIFSLIWGLYIFQCPKVFFINLYMAFSFNLRLVTLFLHIWWMPDTMQVLHRLFGLRKIANRPGLVFFFFLNYNIYIFAIPVWFQMCFWFCNHVKYKFIMVGNFFVYTLLSNISIIQKPRV